MDRITVSDFNREELRQAMAEASSDKIGELEDHSAEILRYMKHGRALRGIKLPWESTYENVRLGTGLSVLAGINGHFKSVISTMIVMNAIRQEHKCGLISLEMPLGDIAEIMAMQLADSVKSPGAEYAENELFPFLRGKFLVYDHIGSIKPMLALGAVQAMAQQGCKLIVLDSMMMTEVNDDNERERAFVQALIAIARTHKVHVMLIHHVRKLPQSDEIAPGRSDIKGSGSIVDLANLCVVVHHNKKKAWLLRKRDQLNKALTKAEATYVEKNPDLRFIVIKNRASPFEGPVALQQHGLNWYEN